MLHVLFLHFCGLYLHLLIEDFRPAVVSKAHPVLIWRFLKADADAMLMWIPSFLE